MASKDTQKTSKVAQWKCKAEASESLTVGDSFTLLCDGESVSLSREKLSLRRPKENPYALKILKLDQLDSSSVRLTATSYVVGQQGTQVAGFGLTDGDNVVEFAPFTLPLKSVITQENNPEGKPFGAAGPVTMQYPLWLWISIAVIGLAILGIAFRFYRIARQRKLFLRELAERSTSLAPYHQFQKDLRQITRALPVSHPDHWQGQLVGQTVGKLESSYHWYLAREFKIPAHKWSSALVNREIKRLNRRLFKKAEKSLVVADRELRRSNKNSSKLTLQDFQQLVEILRKPADVIYNEKNQENRR